MVEEGWCLGDRRLGEARGPTSRLAASFLPSRRTCWWFFVFSFFFTSSADCPHGTFFFFFIIIFFFPLFPFISHFPNPDHHGRYSHDKRRLLETHDTIRKQDSESPHRGPWMTLPTPHVQTDIDMSNGVDGTDACLASAVEVC